MDDGHRGLEPEDHRCTATWFVIPRVHESPPYTAARPTRSTTITPKLLHAVLMLSRIRETILPLDRVRLLFRMRLVHWIQRVSLPRSTKEDGQRVLYPRFHERAFASKIAAPCTWPSNGLLSWRSISHRSSAERWSRRRAPPSCYSPVLRK